MIRVKNLPFDIEYGKDDVLSKLVKVFSCKKEDISSWRICSKSLDARRDIKYIISFDLNMKNEEKCARKARSAGYDIVYPFEKSQYSLPAVLRKPSQRPVVVGFGPSGIFCSLLLAESGFSPIIIERGSDLESRAKQVESFYLTGKLNTETNIQFGEGGAGAFSDGKLTTLIKDRESRCTYILEKFVEFGAPEDILYTAHPHIGTDILRKVIKNMREHIKAIGGEFRFDTKLEEVITDKSTICGIVLSDKTTIQTDTVFLCIGHSARDTFQSLLDSAIAFERKPFSVGVRIEHLQSDVNISRYREKARLGVLPPAEYKAVAHTSNGRALYTFCMCPGGHITAAASEKGTVVTNGMSYHARDGKNANAALLVSVQPEDTEDGIFGGIAFQRKLETDTFIHGGGDYKAPAQTVGDFMNNRRTTAFGKVEPTYPRGVTGVDLNSFLPSFLTETLKLGINEISKQIPCFASPDGVLTAIESRSTCPVRMIRDKETLQSNIKGLYPAGEGGGYAGGIMSAASDGMKVAEKYISTINQE